MDIDELSDRRLTQSVMGAQATQGDVLGPHVFLHCWGGGGVAYDYDFEL